MCTHERFGRDRMGNILQRNTTAKFHNVSDLRGVLSGIPLKYSLRYIRYTTMYLWNVPQKDMFCKVHNIAHLWCTIMYEAHYAIFWSNLCRILNQIHLCCTNRYTRCNLVHFSYQRELGMCFFPLRFALISRGLLNWAWPPMRKRPLSKDRSHKRARRTHWKHNRAPQVQQRV